MRLLRGGSLGDLLKNGPLPIAAFLPILDQVGSALNTAHRLGVIHRDLKPANILLDDDGNAYLADFGIAKNLGDPSTTGRTQAGVLVGSPAYTSPEQIRSGEVRPQADIYCLGILIFEMLVSKQPFHGPTPIDYLMQHLNQPLPALSECNPALPTDLDRVLQRATDKEPATRYADVLSLLTDVHEALSNSIELGLSKEIITLSAEEIAAIANPYKGLRAFGEADAEDFFGRETLVQELLGRMCEENHLGTGADLERFLAVIGPSGSGKSSAVKAGLIPAVRRGGLPGSENWLITHMTPGAHPLEELEVALLRVAVHPPASLLEQLQADPRGLLRAVRRILPDDDVTDLLLVIDQFEELFTLVEDESVRTHFLDSLVNAVLDPQSRLRLVITLRADFTDRPLQYADFGELVRQRTEFVMPLSSEEMEAAINGPAHRVGLIPERELVKHIIRDVGEQPGALPLLQYALTELFERRQGRKLTLAAYEESGGALSALGRRAEEIYTNLDPAEQETARQLFLRLITLGEGVEDTRRRVLQYALEDLAEITPRDENTLQRVIIAFSRYRKLTLDH